SRARDPQNWSVGLRGLAPMLDQLGPLQRRLERQPELVDPAVLAAKLEHATNLDMGGEQLGELEHQPIAPATIDEAQPLGGQDHPHAAERLELLVGHLAELARLAGGDHAVAREPTLVDHEVLAVALADHRAGLDDPHRAGAARASEHLVASVDPP